MLFESKCSTTQIRVIVRAFFMIILMNAATKKLFELFEKNYEQYLHEFSYAVPSPS